MNTGPNPTQCTAWVYQWLLILFQRLVQFVYGSMT